MTSSDEPRRADGRGLLGALAAVVLVILSTLWVVWQLSEVPAVRADPTTYELVYHEPAEMQVVGLYRSAAVGVLLAAIGLMRFVDRRRARAWGVVSATVLLVLAGLVAVGFYLWAASGYDH